MNQELLDLYETGKCRRYKEVERNPELLEGFIRAVDIMKMVTEVSELKGFSYGNPRRSGSRPRRNR